MTSSLQSRYSSSKMFISAEIKSRKMNFASKPTLQKFLLSTLPNQFLGWCYRNYCHKPVPLAKRLPFLILENRLIFPFFFSLFLYLLTFDRRGRVSNGNGAICTYCLSKCLLNIYNFFLWAEISTGTSSSQKYHSSFTSSSCASSFIGTFSFQLAHLGLVFFQGVSNKRAFTSSNMLANSSSSKLPRLGCDVNLTL